MHGLILTLIYQTGVCYAGELRVPRMSAEAAGAQLPWKAGMGCLMFAPRQGGHWKSLVLSESYGQGNIRTWTKTETGTQES